MPISLLRNYFKLCTLAACLAQNLESYGTWSHILEYVITKEQCQMDTIPTITSYEMIPVLKIFARLKLLLYSKFSSSFESIKPLLQRDSLCTLRYGWQHYLLFKIMSPKRSLITEGTNSGQVPSEIPVKWSKCINRYYGRGRHEFKSNKFQWFYMHMLYWVQTELFD